jgi:hypothetical protein
LYAARTLGSPRRFGPIGQLKEAAEKDMLARDVRELFLLPYVQAFRTGRLRGQASGICGHVLSANASVALDALLARGCCEPGPALSYLLEEMVSRCHPEGFFYEPYQEQEAFGPRSRRRPSAFLYVTAAYLRYLVAFGRGRNPRIRAGFDWLLEHQDTDGAWRPPLRELRRDETLSYTLTRAVAAALAVLPASALRRYASHRRKLAVAWSDRILERFEDPDAVLSELNIAEDPRGPSRRGRGPDLPRGLRRRILYFPLEDLHLALDIGASPIHPHLAPWIRWLEETQLEDGGWRLGNPDRRERLLLSDPNGRLRAEALFLTDDWITLRAAQILRLAERRLSRLGVTRVGV